MTDPATPRLSSTILLLRDDPALQVLMVKRHYEIDFASGAYVFPGGKAHDEDEDPAWAENCDGDFTGEEQAARVAAIREAYEESGIILARPASARPAPARPASARPASARPTSARDGCDGSAGAGAGCARDFVAGTAHGRDGSEDA